MFLRPLKSSYLLSPPILSCMPITSPPNRKFLAKEKPSQYSPAIIFLPVLNARSASGLVVKSNVAIVGPPVRFRACAIFFVY